MADGLWLVAYGFELTFYVGVVVFVRGGGMGKLVGVHAQRLEIPSE